MMNLEQVDLLNTSWSYRGEGNANIVIALDQKLRVIRLSKSPKDTQKRKHGTKELDAQELSRRHFEKLIREVSNTNNIVRPLVCPGLVSPSHIVEISQDQIAYLNDKLQSCRPVSRLHKELRFTHGTSHMDFARLHSPESNQIDYCVEIKPKQGWIDHTSWLAEKCRLCNFCAHQFLKLKQSKIVSRTNYCPLDLFSGKPRRMIHSLVSLLQNPQNNLRIFKNGVVVYDETMVDNLPKVLNSWFSNSKDPLLYDEQESEPPEFIDSTQLKRLLYVVCLTLMTPLSSSESTMSNDNKYLKFAKDLADQLNLPNVCIPEKHFNTEHFCHDGDVSQHFSPPSVLSTILFLQQLSQEQPSSIFEIYQKICPIHSCDLGATNQLLELKSASCPDESCFANEVWMDELKESLDRDGDKALSREDEARLENFLLSATAKDCSLMITISSSMALNTSENKLIEKLDPGFKSENPPIFNIPDLYDSSYTHKVKIGLADMDIKPITCVPKQYLRDCDILNSYNEFQMNR